MQSDATPELRRPAVVIAFSGWNDAANAASDAAIYLLQHYDSEEIGRVDDERYYDYQATRPLLRRSPDGPWLQWPHTSLHRVSLPERDLVVVVGPEPSLLWRSFAEELIGTIRRFEPELVVLMGAMLTDTPHSRPLPVSLQSFDPQLRERMLLETPDYEGPTGIVGVINQMMLAERAQTGTAWVSIPHYVAAPPNPKAQFALLTRLEEALGVSIDFGNLAQEADAWTAAVDQLSAEDPDVAEYIEQLEEAKDASDVEEATGDSIAAEFERYLRGRSDGPPLS